MTYYPNYQTTYKVCFAYSFNGKEKDYESGFHYYGSRYYNSELSMWLSTDPRADKYPSLSPYNYCANNPIKLIDPNGEEIFVKDEQSKTNITNTLTESEAQFIKFDKNGRLDVYELNKSESDSENFTALKSLANSSYTYIFSNAASYTDGYGNIENLIGDDGIGTKGITLIPNAEQSPSPDNNIYIITSSLLSSEGQIKNIAHEAYGHAYFYELKIQGVDVNPFHTYEMQPSPDVIWNDEFNTYELNLIRVPSNNRLENQIKIATQQALQNYKSRIK